MWMNLLGCLCCLIKKKTLGQGKLWGSWLGLPAWDEPVAIAVPALTPDFVWHCISVQSDMDHSHCLVFISVLDEGTGGHRADVAAGCRPGFSFGLWHGKQTENQLWLHAVLKYWLSALMVSCEESGFLVGLGLTWQNRAGCSAPAQFYCWNWMLCTKEFL